MANTYQLRKGQKVYLFFKRGIDITGSILGIIVCSLLLWWWVIIVQKISSKGPVFFVQERRGRNDKFFKLIKFRSMRTNVDPNLTSNAINLQDSVTPFGKFLRRSSIDETPQLLNVLVGQMSFIGPRPLIDVGEDSITLNIRRENGAIILKPGISGYAQINGRTSVSPVDKGNYDGFYFRNISFSLDVSVFFKTIFHIN